ncbi:hypothetical protein H5410_041118 [Solanum commersonii]|uniref:Uncharacterized protein n=1 Tax=Solanum commersonii TaxID=4109 RepID=A0A9J5XTK2_SOLCO|nr:hypothetical protein H5410_041118 [Solanum commersonii]
MILTIGIRAFDPTTCELKMVEGTRIKQLDNKLARHDEHLTELLNTQQDVRNTQTKIQGTLELILDHLTALERAPNRVPIEQQSGNDSMKKHNPTKFDHERNCVTIRRKNNKLVLKGISEEGNLSMINSGAMGKLLKKGNVLFAHLFMMNSTTYQDQEMENEGVDDIKMQETGQLMMISTTIHMWIQEVNNSYKGDSQALELLAQTTVGQQGPSLWHFSSSILKRKGKVYMGGNGDLSLQLISKFHDSPLGGHSGEESQFQVKPVAILQRQQIKRNNVAVVKVLV